MDGPYNADTVPTKSRLLWAFFHLIYHGLIPTEDRWLWRALLLLKNVFTVPAHHRCHWLAPITADHWRQWAIKQRVNYRVVPADVVWLLERAAVFEVVDPGAVRTLSWRARAVEKVALSIVAGGQGEVGVEVALKRGTLGFLFYSLPVPAYEVLLNALCFVLDVGAVPALEASVGDEAWPWWAFVRGWGLRSVPAISDRVSEGSLRWTLLTLRSTVSTIPALNWLK